MKMRHKRFRTRAKMVRAFWKGIPIDIETIKNPIIRLFIKFFNAIPVRATTIAGRKEIKRGSK